jgi:hypothetical protein
VDQMLEPVRGMRDVLPVEQRRLGRVQAALKPNLLNGATRSLICRFWNDASCISKNQAKNLWGQLYIRASRTVSCTASGMDSLGTACVLA